jgi:mutator protein MutT
MGKRGIRAVAILLNTNNLLLMHRYHDGKEFWVLPGGGVENNENIEDAVIREVHEEASIKCDIVKLLYTHYYPDLGHEQYYYLCKYISGDPKLGEYNEFHTMKTENQKYEPEWVNVQNLSKLLLYPLEIRDWLIEDLKNDFEKVPKVATLMSTSLRQEI